MRFAIATAAIQPLLIPAGTRVATLDAKLAFITDEDVLIPAGQTQVIVTATCSTVGEAGNGWAVGQISVITNPPFAGLLAANIAVSFDGAEDEDDDRYRERIILAPEAYSNAGSRGLTAITPWLYTNPSWMSQCMVLLKASYLGMSRCFR